MESTKGYNVKLTAHARKQMKVKKVEDVRLAAAFAAPEKMYPNRKYEGQFRVVGNGLCLVGKPQGSDFVVFTIYEDGVMTPPREDQLGTPEGEEYAALYAEYLKTGKVARKNEYYPRAKNRRKGDVRHTTVR